jgi:hypothetical protein
MTAGNTSNLSNASTMQIKVDADGIPILPLPQQESSIMRQLLLKFFMYILFPIFVPLIVFRAAKKNSIAATVSTLKDLYKTVSDAHKAPIKSLAQFQNKILLGKVWKQPSAAPYISRNALEYQKREGYCGRSTLRNILKSFPTFPPELIPEPCSGASDPTKWSKVIHDIAHEHHRKMPSIETNIVPGDLPYEEFLDTIRTALSDESCRIAVNYLRPALVGFKTPKWIPIHFLFGLLGGHFSPIVGIWEDRDSHGYGSTSTCSNSNSDPMIAVFDVNHSYGGAYLVPARRLYESVKAHDLMTGKSRALVVLRMDGNNGSD